MFELMVEMHFSAAHCIRGHSGRCAQLHGHNYRVVIAVTAQRLNEQGMVIDFADLKAVCHDAIDGLDHTVLNDLPVFRETNPTAEAVAHHLYQAIAGELQSAAEGRIALDRVTVYESESSYATYRR
jgi:6-pyruvoyltetrahydropterin/6-carboxytetrahydropterin synthase